MHSVFNEILIAECVEIAHVSVDVEMQSFTFWMVCLELRLSQDQVELR